jgi:hypothetical protein
LRHLAGLRAQVTRLRWRGRAVRAVHQQLHQVAIGLGALVELAQRQQRGLVRRIDVQCAIQQVERRISAPGVGLVPVGDQHAQRHRVRRAIGVLDRLAQREQHLAPLLLRGQPLDRALDRFVLGVLGERLSVGEQGALGLR